MGYLELVRKGTPCEQLMFVCGHIAAGLMGSVIPVFQIFLADSFDAFGNPDKDEQMKEIKKITIIISCLGAFTWVMGYFYWVMLSQFSMRVTARIKQQYLEAILRQECAWFDQINYTELSTKLAKECSMIQIGLSEKGGALTNAFATFISGLVVGFYMGWAMSLALLILVPVIGLIGWCFSYIQQGAVKKSLIAYAQSAGYAEQALMAIRVVVAFGMEAVEYRNYTAYLQQAKDNATKNHFKSAGALGLVFVAMYASYAYAFYIGSVYVRYEVWNNGRDRPYSGGDSIGVFFAVLIGLFSLSMVSNQFKAIN